MATNFSLDPSVLPPAAERKGTLNLRSDHMKYGRATLNSHWHAAREAEPKDYDVTNSNAKQDLLKATYCRIGNCDEGFPETTTVEAMSEVHRLKNDFKFRPTQNPPVNADNFTQSMSTPRNTGTPREGYGSTLPRHGPEHGKRHLNTTYGTDYQREWSPAAVSGDHKESPAPSHHHTISEFTDTADHRRRGVNTWQDSLGSSQTYNITTSS